MSFPTAAELADYPGLVPWLIEGDWSGKFEARALIRDHGVRIASIVLREHAPGIDDFENCKFLADAQVKGSAPRPYRTRLFFFAHYDSQTRTMVLDMETECSCYHGNRCKHAVAVLETLKAIAASTPDPAGPRISMELANWLHQIKETGTSKPAARKSPAKSYNKFLAYCIEPQTNPYARGEERLVFALRVGNHTKSGFYIESNTATADPSRPAKYMIVEDLPICAKYHQRSRKHRGWSGNSALEGDDWDEILTAALATGRLFFGTPDPANYSSSDYHRLTEGPPLPVEPAWEILPNGDARPILKLPSPEIRLLLTKPLRYLDPANYQLGNLLSHMPSAMLKVWAGGPAIQPDSIPELNRQLAAISPENPLPLPADHDARVLTGLAPVPCLHITEVFVGVFLKRHLGGLLKFRISRQSGALSPRQGHPHQHGLDGRRDRVISGTRPQGGTRAWPANSSASASPRCTKSSRITNSTTKTAIRSSCATSPRPPPPIGWNSSRARECHATQGRLAGSSRPTPNSASPSTTSTTSSPPSRRIPTTASIGSASMSPASSTANASASSRTSPAPSARTGTCAIRIPHQFPKPSCSPATIPPTATSAFPPGVSWKSSSRSATCSMAMPHGDGPMRLDRLGAAGVADALAIEVLGNHPRAGRTRPQPPRHPGPAARRNSRHHQGAELRHYQMEGFRWLQFLPGHGLHGILADDMGLGKTLQTLAHLAAEHAQIPGHAVAGHRPHLGRSELGRRSGKIRPASQGARAPRRRPRRSFRADRRPPTSF